MTHLSHLIAADVRRSGLLLGMWVSIEIANTVLLVFGPRSPPIRV